MRPLILATTLLAFIGMGEQPIEAWMQNAFYPTILLVLIVASLGVPIPEDVPLIAAGVLLKTHEGIATWPGTIFIALVGIMVGDLVLYSAGKRWGEDVVQHRFVRRLITPARFRLASKRFRDYGTWFCFFGRFVMGVRAAMCITAGASRFPYWRFFLADFAGALISVPLWILLGYWFAGKLPELQGYLTGIKGTLAAVGVAAVIALIIYYKVRHARRLRRADERIDDEPGAPQETQPAAPRDVSDRAVAEMIVSSKRAPAPPANPGPKSLKPATPAKV